MAKILLVEDDGVLREDLGYKLRAWGHEIDLASDLQPAYEALHRRRPELILSDVHLPSGTGFDLLRRVGDKQFGMVDTPIILISSLDDQPSMLYGELCGAADYLIKPIDYAVLKTLVDQRLQGSKNWLMRTLMGDVTPWRASRRSDKPEAMQRSTFGMRR